MIYLIKKCPKCFKQLKSISVSRNEVAEYTDGSYVDNGQGSVSIYCNKCGSKIGFSNANESWGKEYFPDYL